MELKDHTSLIEPFTVEIDLHEGVMANPENEQVPYASDLPWSYGIRASLLGAHHSVNTGNEDLVSYCVYPLEAGHNYGDIKSGWICGCP